MKQAERGCPKTLGGMPWLIYSTPAEQHWLFLGPTSPHPNHLPYNFFPLRGETSCTTTYHSYYPCTSLTTDCNGKSMTSSSFICHVCKLCLFTESHPTKKQANEPNGKWKIIMYFWLFGIKVQVEKVLFNADKGVSWALGLEIPNKDFSIFSSFSSVSWDIPSPHTQGNDSFCGILDSSTGLLLW